MPQSSDRLRKLWGGVDGIGDDKAIAFLESKGWEQKPTGMWRRPDNDTSGEELDALQFLIEEWDHDFYRL